MSSPSWWHGASRRPLRLLLGGLLCHDAIVTAAMLSATRPSAISHPGAPGWLLALGGRPWVLAPLALGVVALAVRFARRAGAVLEGLLALVLLGILIEAQAALLEGPMRFLFFSGACTAGWLLGLLFARWSGLSLTAPPDADAAEAFAEQGAVASLAACYLGAITSKLSTSGLHWALGGGVQYTVAAQHSWGRSGLTDALALWVVTHDRAGQALSALTMLAQASALAMPFSRYGRSVAAVLLLSFHLGVWLLTPIVFPQAMVLLLAFGFPWHRLFARPQEEVSLPALSRRALSRLSLVLAAVVAVCWLPPLRAYTRQHHSEERTARGRPPPPPPPEAPRSPPAPPPLSPELQSLLGPLTVGATVEDLRVARVLAGGPDTARVELERGDLTVVLELLPRGRRGAASAPASSAHADLFFGRSPPGRASLSDAELVALLRRLAERLP